MNSEQLWQTIRDEAQQFAASEPLLSPYLQSIILEQPSLNHALALHLAKLLKNDFVGEAQLREVMGAAFRDEPAILLAAGADIVACRERDAACTHYLMPVLYFKGFHALQCYRVAHYLYRHGQRALAYFFQNLVSQLFSVDIHPAAKIGLGILMDHATGVVIGETAIVEDNVSMLHVVTLGGSGIEHGCVRHPTIRRGVLLSTGAKVLGCIEVGEGAKVAAGSLVLENVPPHTTVAGIPAKVVGKPAVAEPALSMNHELNVDND
jgi:serine O-acetyltransferase